MKYLILILLILFFVPTAIVSAEDVIVETKDGSKVVLHEDGSWEYGDAGINNQKGEIAIRKFSKTLLPTDVNAERYYDTAQLSLFIENNTGKTIKAWKAILGVMNPFGDMLFNCQLTAGVAAIIPGPAEESRFEWKDNPFMDGEAYDHLATYSTDNLKLSLTDIKIIH